LKANSFSLGLRITKRIAGMKVPCVSSAIIFKKELAPFRSAFRFQSTENTPVQWLVHVSRAFWNPNDAASKRFGETYKFLATMRPELV
jgi:hypothetical protein